MGYLLILHYTNKIYNVYLLHFFYLNSQFDIISSLLKIRSCFNKDGFLKFLLVQFKGWLCWFRALKILDLKSDSTQLQDIKFLYFVILNTIILWESCLFTIFPSGVLSERITNHNLSMLSSSSCPLSSILLFYYSLVSSR